MSPVEFCCPLFALCLSTCLVKLFNQMFVCWCENCYYDSFSFKVYYDIRLTNRQEQIYGQYGNCSSTIKCPGGGRKKGRMQNESREFRKVLTMFLRDSHYIFDNSCLAIGTWTWQQKKNVSVEYYSHNKECLRRHTNNKFQ